MEISEHAEMKADIPYPEDMNDDFTIDQKWDSYSAQDHAIWHQLYERQTKLLPNRACQEFLDGMKALNLDVGHKIPRFEELSEELMKRTQWQIVAVPGLIPDDVFFEHMANRRFPVTYWIRKPEELDYLQEPDVFHDLFGHVPLLCNPVFADYLQAYGRGGMKAWKLGYIKNLARLYWYTVEFGLIRRDGDLRIYGAGILSSKGECVYCLDNPKPNRVAFNLKRIMQSEYRIDDFQETYFVIENFEQLFEATRPDFIPYYKELEGKDSIDPTEVLDSDTKIYI